MANRGQRGIAVVETDMARLADARMAVEDLECLLVRFACRPVVSVEDAERLGYNLQRVRMGFGVVEKYLRWAREEMGG